MKWFIPIVIVVSLCLTTGAAAQPVSFGINSWGFYFSQTVHRLNSAPTKYELYQTNTAGDIGVFYSRYLGYFLSAQIEARYGVREAGIELGDISTRINEEFLEIPMIIHVNALHLVGISILRVFAGAGISYRVLTEQEIASHPSEELPGNVTTPIDFGGYQKLAWVMDGGASLMLKKRSGIFASYRLTNDWKTFGESDDVLVMPKYYTYGFQVGFEFRFGPSLGTTD